jgi:pimeloyl-ACP methyl ester carboxylesterase
VLLGGPGSAASHSYAATARAHAEANATRDVILADQRGTGRSSPISCTHGSDDELQTYMDAFLPLDAGERCVAALAGTTDVTRYRTVDFIADLEDLRAALGIERWNLHGTSYGTRVALQYLARHPARIRSAVLAGVAPPELVMPMPFPADADRALAMVLALCRADAACGEAFPNLDRELDSVVTRLERAPGAAHVRHPVTGEVTRVSFSRGAFGESVRAALYTPNGARQVPLAIHEAYRGEYTALASAHLARQRTVARQGWAGLYLAATCPEDIARLDSASTFARSRNTLLGPYRARIHFRACQGWPAPATDDTWPDEARIATPVLMIVGDLDPVTPPRWARLALERMDNGRLIVIPFGGHGFAGLVGRECIDRLVVAFYERPDPHRLDAACVSEIRLQPFALKRER